MGSKKNLQENLKIQEDHGDQLGPVKKNYRTVLQIWTQKPNIIILAYKTSLLITFLKAKRQPLPQRNKKENINERNLKI